MSNLVEMYRKHRGTSPSPEASTSTLGATNASPMKSPYPTTPSKPWVPGSSLANKRKSKDMGPKKSPYPTKPSAASTSSLPKIDEPPTAPVRIFSSPEPPFQIPDTIVVVTPVSESPIMDNASTTDSSAESAGPTTPIHLQAQASRSSRLSYSSKPLPATPERVYLRAPSYAPPRRYSTSPRPSTHVDLSGSSHFSHETSETTSTTATSTRDRSCEPLIRTVAPPDITGQLPSTQPPQLKYDVPPPAYQTLETIDDDLDFPSPPPTDEKGFATFQGIPIHQHYFAPRQIASSISSLRKAEPPMPSFLDMN